MEREKDRIQWLDAAKAFAIYLVILGHVIQWTFPGNPYHDNAAFCFIYAFHMPLFMAMSGFFIERLLVLSPLVFVQRRAVQLLFPVLSFAAIYLGVRFLFVAPPTHFWREVGDYLSGGDLWFLKYLFADLCVIYASKRLLRHDALALLPTLALFFLTRAGVFRFLPYLWLGYFLYKYQNRWAAHLRIVTLISLVTFVLSLFYWRGDYDAPLRFLVLHPTVHFDGPKTWAVAVRLAVGLSGSLFFLSLFRMGDPVIRRYLHAPSSALGQNTLGIYALQLYLLEHLLGENVSLQLVGPFSLLWQLLIAIGVLLVCYALCLLLRNHALSALLFLGVQPKPTAQTTGSLAALSPWQQGYYQFLFGLVYFLSLFPLRLLYLLSDVLYVLVYHLVGYRRKLVRRHLADSFPEKSSDERRHIERRFYHWFCDYIVETLKLFSMSHDEMRRRMVFKNVTQMEEILERGQGIALYLGHYCNWEWISSIPLWLHGRYAGSQVYHILENPVMDRLLLYPRHRMGPDNVPMAGVLRYIVEKRQQGLPVVMGFIADQVPFWNNIGDWLTFLSHPQTPVLVGTERVARRFGMACVYIDVRRVRRGYYEAEFQLMTENPDEQPELSLTRDYFARLEQSIRRQPHLWLWTHNRWKRTREEYDSMIDPKTGNLRF